MALTKAQLIALFQGMDVNTLQDLYTLSQTIFTPQQDQLVNVTFAQMVTKAHSLADIYFPDWTDRGEADFGEFIIELVALFSEKDFWYINAFGNEGFLGSAALYTSVYAHALRLGYAPITYKSATTQVSLVFAPSAGFTIPPGGIQIGNVVPFSNRDVLTIPASSSNYTLVVTLYQGYFQNQTTIFNGKSVIIGVNSIDPLSVTQTDNNVVWTNVPSFAMSNNASTVFMVLPDFLGTIQTVYGNGVLGAKPALNDTMVTTYMITQGLSGNLPQAQLDTTIVTQPTGGTIISATYLTDSTGGTNAETIDQIKANASFYFRGQNNIVNSADCMIVLNLMPDIHQSFAFVLGSIMYFEVIPEDGSVASPAFLQIVQNRIKNIVTELFSLQPMGTVYVDVAANPGDLTFDAIILNQFNQVNTVSTIQILLEQYTDPLQNAVYGQGFVLGDVAQFLIDNTPGLQNIVFHKVQGVVGSPPPDVNIAATAILKKINLANVVINPIGGS